MMRALFVFASLVSLAACRGPVSQVVVIVDAEPAVRAQMRGLQVQIFGDARGEDLEAVPDQLIHNSIVPTDQGGFAWPRRYVVTPAGGDPTRLYRFEAIARTQPALDAPQLVLARVISGYQRGQTVTIHLLLTDSCIGVDCTDPDLTCDPALRRCVDARRDEETLPPFDAGTPDAGTPVPSCTTDADCEDGEPCTENICYDGECGTRFVDDLCTGDVSCAMGRCLPSGCESIPVDANCTDGVPCTVDECDLGAGCVNTPNDALCSMGTGGDCTATGCQYDTCVLNDTCVNDACFTGARCNGSLCERVAVCPEGNCCNGNCGCDDDNPCTADSCDTVAGRCINEPMPFAWCSDGNACTAEDACDATGLTCVPGPPDPCDDGNPCTGPDTCNPSAGCSNPNNDALSCDDGDGCSGDYCSGGACFSGGGCLSDGGPPYDAGWDAGGPGWDGGGPGWDAGWDAGGPGDGGGGLCEINEDCGQDDFCTQHTCSFGWCYIYEVPGCSICGADACYDGRQCCDGVCCPIGDYCDGLSCRSMSTGCPGGCGAAGYCCLQDGGANWGCQAFDCATSGPDAGFP